MPTKVLIAGGGPAAVEAALALRRLAGARVQTTLLCPNAELAYRPLTVLEPFAAGAAPSYPLARIAADAGFTQHRGALARVDAAAHTVTTAAGDRIGYDALLVALGARAGPPVPAMTTFTGSAADAERLHGLVRDVEDGYTKRVAFVLPSGVGWSLPLYELALMLAERAFDMGVGVELHLVTPESAPLSAFGADAAREVEQLLRDAGVALHAARHAERIEGGLRLVPGDEQLAVERVVTLPQLTGPAIAGLPSDTAGFLVTDSFCRVTGVPDVYVAGDATAFPVKQGGIACQQADVAAAQIATAAGAPVATRPFRPVLRGLLVTERREHPLRGDAKIAGRELAPYLRRLDAERVQGSASL